MTEETMTRGARAVTIAADGVRLSGDLAWPQHPGGLVLFYVPDVDAWYEEFKSRSVSVHEPPNESLQGLRDMTVIDPDGNKLRFCTRLKEWRR